MSAAEKKLPDAATLTVFVVAPSEPTPREFTWHRSMKVGEAAKEAAAAMGFTGQNPTFMTAEGKVLDRTLPLAGAHVRDGDQLELVDVGGGV